MCGGIVPSGRGETFSYSASTIMEEGEPEIGKMKHMVNHVPATNDIIITPELVKDGTKLSTVNGNKKFGADHALFHEFVHAIISTIEQEFGGKFNDVDFSKMSPQESADWTIKFSNTLLQSQNQPLETGAFQHKRKENEMPEPAAVAPLTK